MPITLNGNGTVTGLAVGGLPDGVVDTDTLANNAVTSAKSTINPGEKVWLAKVDDGVSGHVQYANNVQIFNMTSYLSTYDKFYIDLVFVSTNSSGSLHLYFKFHDSSNNEMDIRYVGKGYSSGDSSIVTAAGTGDYFRPNYAVQAGTTFSSQFYIENSRSSSDNEWNAHITGRSCWYREGGGVTACDIAAMAQTKDKFGYFLLDADAHNGNGTHGKVLANLYGITQR